MFENRNAARYRRSLLSWGLHRRARGEQCRAEGEYCRLATNLEGRTYRFASFYLRTPDGIGIVGLIIGQPANVTAIGIHTIDLLRTTVPIRCEHDLRPIRRPIGFITVARIA